MRICAPDDAGRVASSVVENLKQTGCVPARPTSGRGRKPSPLKIAVAPAPAAGSVRGFTSRPGASLRAARATWGALRIWGPWSVTVIGLAGGSLALFVFHQGMQLLLLLLLLLMDPVAGWLSCCS